MHRKTGRALGAVVAAVVLFAAAAAEAVDAPRWVAAIFIQAQKAVGLRWKPVPGATGYKVLRSTSPGKDYAEIGSVAQPQLIDSAVEPGTTYYYVLVLIADDDQEVLREWAAKGYVVEAQPSAEVVLSIPDTTTWPPPSYLTSRCRNLPPCPNHPCASGVKREPGQRGTDHRPQGHGQDTRSV